MIKTQMIKSGDTLPGKTSDVWVVFNRECVDNVHECATMAADDVAEKKILFPELSPWLYCKYSRSGRIYGGEHDPEAG